METGNEKQNVNIAEVLRYAPKMLELFSPIYGEVCFDYVNEEGTDIHVKTKLCGGSVATFNANGTFYNLPNSECLLFPSVNHRCWNHWQNTLFLESIGRVCVDTITGNKFILGKDGTYFGDNTGGYYSVIIENDLGNYLLNSCYASPSQTKEFFEELNNNGYKWDGEKVVKKGNIKPKFKVGDIVKFDRPSAMLKREILSIDFENERYLTRRTDIGGAIKEFIYFCEQDDYVIVGSHNSLSNLSIEVKVSVLMDEINSIKQDIESLKESRNRARMRIDSLENWVIENGNPDIFKKVSVLADEIIDLRLRVKALEIQVIKDMSTPPLTKDPYFKSNKITCDDAQCYKGKSVSDAFETPDKAGDCVTLKDMKS